jgi:hypothetical protein
VVDPAAFFQMTKKNVTTPKSTPAPGPGGTAVLQLLQTGIVSKVLVTFVGQLTVATAAVTASDQWPYNLLKFFKLSANGANDLWSCDGIDLAALRFLRYPAYAERVDVFPDQVGGGGSIGVGTYDLYLTWEVPVAMDDTSLVGSLYAQSSATALQVSLTQAVNADLFSANPGNATITGTFYVSEVFFDVPFNADGALVVPDLSRLHGFNAVDVPITNTGETRIPLIRSQGQLSRLLTSVRSSPTQRLSAKPGTPANRKIDAIRLEYGGNQRPLVFDPAALLLAINNQHYGAPVPYDRLVFDFVRENPPRDVILMAGVTELAVVPKVNTAVSISGGSVRIVQETLF